MNFKELRDKYSTFIYKSCELQKYDNYIEIKYKFVIKNLCEFTPVTKVYFSKNCPSLSNLQYLAVNLGMVEAISYYKAVCCRQIVIKAGYFNEQQLEFWKKLYYKGLGEFFYVNNIDVSKHDIFEFKCECEHKNTVIEVTNNYGVIIPVGGGKDSVVTLELLKQFKNSQPFVLNANPAINRCVKISGYPGFLKATRTISENLIKLNKHGFLNGHTPFSAMLAFLTTFSAYINNKKFIALSNESSANEGNVKGLDVNHQYSKSFEFEQDFNNYINSYVIKGINYFSFLRPLSELAIAALFSSFKKYHTVFRSCNKGSKIDAWCGKCSKCLFVYIMLCPFLDDDELKTIFGKNMLDDINLEYIFKQLTGLEKVKPLECVGTRQEVNAALLKKYLNKKNLPILVKKHINKIKSDFDYKSFYDENNNLNKKFEEVLKKAICKL